MGGGVGISGWGAGFARCLVLLLAGNLAACKHHLGQLTQPHPAGDQRRAAIANWERSMGPWRRLLLALGVYGPRQPMALGCAPGALR